MTTITNEEYADYAAKLAERDAEYFTLGASIVDDLYNTVKDLQKKIADAQATMPAVTSAVSSNARTQTDNTFAQLSGTIQQIMYLKQNLDSIQAQYVPTAAEPAPAS